MATYTRPLNYTLYPHSVKDMTNKMQLNIYFPFSSPCLLLLLVGVSEDKGRQAGQRQNLRGEQLTAEQAAVVARYE